MEEIQLRKTIKSVQNMAMAILFIAIVATHIWDVEYNFWMLLLILMPLGASKLRTIIYHRVWRPDIFDDMTLVLNLMALSASIILALLLIFDLVSLWDINRFSNSINLHF